MSDKKQLSHSAYRRYLNCPKSYDNHYNKRIRQVGTSSALVFGTAIDEALNALLTDKGNPHAVFKEHFTFEMVEGIKFHKDDYDYHLFSVDQLEKLKGKSTDYANWASLRIKGRMMIDAYIEEIVPLIKKVHSVQMELKGRRGFIDAILEIDGYGKVLIDHKTASRAYKDDVINADTQLHLYALDQGIDKVGFIVLNKKIEHNKVCSKCKRKCVSSHKTCPQEVRGKRCFGEWDRTPSINVQVIINKVNVFQTKILSNSVSDVENAIDIGVYPANLGACHSFYGANCPYLDFCRKGDMIGLEHQPEEKKK